VSIFPDDLERKESAAGVARRSPEVLAAVSTLVVWIGAVVIVERIYCLEDQVLLWHVSSYKYP
jgi:hypothetical protein